jgi:hypothetical protein
MSSVVNGGDGVATLLSESQYIIDQSDYDADVKELLGEEYEPQTPIERMARWAEEIGGLLSSEKDDGNNLTSITVLMDDSDIEKLIEQIKDNAGAFYDRQGG